MNLNQVGVDNHRPLICRAVQKMGRSLNHFGLSVVVSFGALVVGHAMPATAVETITLTFQGDTVEVPFSNLKNFSETGAALTERGQEFVGRHPVLARILQEVMSAEIYIHPDFQTRERSSVVEFLLLKLNTVLSNSTVGSDLEPIRTALRASYQDDNRFSLIEVIGNYPREDILVDLNRLEPIYNDVRAFVERIQPALAAIREFLQEYVCDCESPAAATPTETTPTPAPESLTTPEESVAPKQLSSSASCPPAE